MKNSDIDRLVRVLARLPGLGPRSARRAVLALLSQRETLMLPLAEALRQAAEAVVTCQQCGNFDLQDPCSLCQDPHRDKSRICVVEDVGDLWALERSGAYRGLYHVLHGTLSALEGRGPESLKIDSLKERAEKAETQEIILALNATVDGQTTAHYIRDRLADCTVDVTLLAQGVPIGGELEYLDGGTLSTALAARRKL